MLTSTFVLLQGIGPATERRLWQDGILQWNTFLAQPSVPGISSARKCCYNDALETAHSRLQAGRADYFGDCLKSRDHWRLFDTFRCRTLYLDIETTGLSAREGKVTVIGLFRNGRMSSLVRGENLTEDRLEDELDRTDLLVTFFGTGFDIPFLHANFPRLNWRKPHFDLCLAARRLGLHGGLKSIERTLCIEREDSVDGLDGWDAVRLWHRWQGGDESALDLLLRYNAADTRNLEPLAETLFEQLVQRYGPPSVGIGNSIP
ncbi:ribonuclease H-like domain-containing protein [Petrachloros mirabilis]